MDYAQKFKLIESLEKGLVTPRERGGQTTGMFYSKVFIRSEEADFYLEIGTYRSQYKNLKLAVALFEAYLDKI